MFVDEKVFLYIVNMNALEIPIVVMICMIKFYKFQQNPFLQQKYEPNTFKKLGIDPLSPVIKLGRSILYYEIYSRIIYLLINIYIV